MKVCVDARKNSAFFAVTLLFAVGSSCNKTARLIQDIKKVEPTVSKVSDYLEQRRDYDLHLIFNT